MDPRHDQEGKRVKIIHVSYIESFTVHLKKNALKNLGMTQGSLDMHSHRITKVNGLS